MNLNKVDWLNHGIAFVSSVVGIFIAFQLSDWQERRTKESELETTLQAIKLEIEGNIAIFKTNDSTLASFLDYLDFLESHSASGDLWGGELLCTEAELVEMKQKHPNRFNSIELIGKMRDGRSRYKIRMEIDVIPGTGISTGNWEAAKAAGILNYVDHARMVLLTQIYEWTQKRLGVTDEEFQNNFVHLEKYESMSKIFDDYRLIQQASGMKYREVKRYYDLMEW